MAVLGSFPPVVRLTIYILYLAIVLIHIFGHLPLAEPLKYIRALLNAWSGLQQSSTLCLE